LRQCDNPLEPPKSFAEALRLWHGVFNFGNVPPLARLRGGRGCGCGLGGRLDGLGSGRGQLELCWVTNRKEIGPVPRNKIKKYMPTIIN